MLCRSKERKGKGMELGLSLGDAAGSSKPFEWMEKSHTHAHTRTSRGNKGIGFCMELSIGPTSSVREDGDDDNRKPTQEDEDHHHHEDRQTETATAAAAARLVDSAEIRRCSTPTATAETANIIQQLDLLPNTPVVVPLPRNPTPSSILASFPAANWTSAGSSEAAGSGQMARDANKLPMAIPAPLDLLVPHHNDDEDPSSPEAEDGDGSHGAGALSSSSLNTTSSAQMDFCIHSSNHHHNDTSTTGTGGTNNIRKSCGDIFRASNDNNNEVVDGCSELEDENGCSTRKKLRLSKQQSAFLEESFKEHTTLTPKQKLALAKQLNLRPRQVEVWFQNRRARTKLKQTEVDCEYLKRCCETLTEENRRLQKELQELRALKSTAGNNPFYMQLPATTLTMCPSCERVATNINPPPLPTTTTTPPKATSTSTGSSPLSSRPILQAFWPGLQVLAGDIDPAVRTHAAFFSVWKRYGFTPEGFNLATLTIQQGQKSYPLRPELIESTYLLYKATRDPRYLDAGRDMVASLQYGTRCPCGYCHISDVEFHKKEDHMESFFLAETVKYLWLLFDLAVGPDNLVENGPYKYIFSTEGHLLPATPQISLKREHCSYFGAYCKDSDSKQGSETSGVSADPQETNGSKFYGSWVHTGFPSDSFLESTSVPGLIKGLCPGLTHGQKYGITYLPLVDTAPEDVSPTQKEPSQPTVVQSHSVVVVSDQGAHLIQSKPNSDHKNTQEVSPGGPESDPPKI